MLIILVSILSKYGYLFIFVHCDSFSLLDVKFMSKMSESEGIDIVLTRNINSVHINVQVRYSLEAAKLALRNVSNGVYDASAGIFI